MQTALQNQYGRTPPIYPQQFLSRENPQQRRKKAEKRKRLKKGCLNGPPGTFKLTDKQNVNCLKIAAGHPRLPAQKANASLIEREPA